MTSCATQPTPHSPRFGASVYHAVRLPADHDPEIGDHHAEISDHDPEIAVITMPETR
jgi:hypothetical protein